ncbi:MAG: carboxypeptidase regulatory-like domain-containing protein [Acidobacteriota bacterium]|nr:carboxypeptidase regulatory-like domain-containing protein [Acidobacteriota bacterium]
MRKTLCTSLLLLLLCGALALTGWAQTLGGGAIQGTVTDASGAVVPGTAVSARNIATNLTYESTSDQTGRYAFPVVRVGTYELTASKSGFAPVKLEQVVVSVGVTQSVTLTMRVATSKEEVTVTAEAATVDVDRTSVASNVNQRAIENLPTNGRNFIDFVLLTPGVVKDPNRGGDLSFAGMRGTVNSLTVDGNDDNNSFYGQAAARVGFKAPSQFSQDAVQEFQVASNGFSAELGRAGGAVINAVTKSGTNKFHGDLFEFYRDQSLDAYDPIQKLNFFANPSNAGKQIAEKSKYHYNQFGGSLGGPIWKDRVFFFFNLDDQRNTVPNVITPLANLVTSTTGFNTEQTTAYNYLLARDGSWSKTNNQNSYLLKLDGNISSKHQISARWNRQRFTAGNQENSGSTVSLENSGNSYIHTDNANVSLTSTLSPHVVNLARIAYLRDREPGVANSSKPMATVANGGSTLLSVGENYYSPRETTIRQFQYSDSVNWMFNRHTLKIGGDAVVAKIKNFFPGNFFGQYTFNGSNGLFDFGCSLLGEMPATVSNGMTCTSPTYVQAFAGAGTTGATTHPDTFEPSIFVQDDYHPLKNLVLNLGFRYDYQGTKQSGVQNTAALALGYNTAKQVVANDEVAPRFGFAYDIFSDGKVLLRGGYGLFYGTTNSMLLATAMSNNGINVSNYTYSGSAVPTYPGILSSAGSISAAIPSIWVVAPNFRNPVVQQMNLGLEIAIAKDTTLSVSGLRVKGDHMARTADVNMKTPVLTNVLDTNGVAHPYYISPGRISSSFYRISEFQSNADSNYHALVVELKKRFSHHFQGSANYTWSHAIDNNPDATSVTIGSGDDAKEPMYPTMPWLDRGNAGADVRNRLNVGYVWTLDYGTHKGLKSALLDGWSTSGIIIAQSGLPYSAMVSNLYLLTNGASLSGLTANVRDSLVARNSLRMPATWEFDPRVTRDIKLPCEGVKVSLFAEGFNMLNRFNVSSVRTTELKYSGGVLTPQTQAVTKTAYFGMPNMSSPTQRIIQLGAKIVF